MDGQLTQAQKDHLASLDCPFEVEVQYQDPPALTRRQLLKTLVAAYAALAVPIVVADRALELVVEIDQDKLQEALSISTGGVRGTRDSDGGYRMEVTVSCDEAKLWQAVYATDQYGRLWTTPDGNTWSRGSESFTLEDV